MERWSLVCLGLLLMGACRTAPDAAGPLARTVWVDRWDWRSARDVERVIEECSQAGFTAVMFQVRGNGTALWPSRNEVWSERFAFKDPGFDPLRVALEAARARGLQFHAWLNAMPGWVGEQQPGDERQLWLSRPDWFLMGPNGHRQQQASGKYLTLNPCLPEVRRYLAQLCSEIVEAYPVDGLHLDYIRFPDLGPGEDELGSDPRTIALYTAATGARPTDRARLERWRRECVTRTVEEVAAAVRGAGRRVLLTAAVFADLEAARDKVRQDWPEWCRRRLVDAVFPMNYTDNDAEFAMRSRAAVAAAGRVPVVMGVGLYKHADGAQTRRQLDAAMAAGAAGVAVFNYRTLLGSGGPAAAAAGADPASVRQAIRDWLGRRRS